MFNKIVKLVRLFTLILWSIILVGNICIWMFGGTIAFGWLDIFLHEIALVSMALLEIIRDNNLF